MSSRTNKTEEKDLKAKAKAKAGSNRIQYSSTQEPDIARTAVVQTGKKKKISKKDEEEDEDKKLPALGQFAAVHQEDNTTTAQKKQSDEEIKNEASTRKPSSGSAAAGRLRTAESSDDSDPELRPGAHRYGTSGSMEEDIDDDNGFQAQAQVSTAPPVVVGGELHTATAVDENALRNQHLQEFLGDTQQAVVVGEGDADEKEAIPEASASDEGDSSTKFWTRKKLGLLVLVLLVVIGVVVGVVVATGSDDEGDGDDTSASPEDRNQDGNNGEGDSSPVPTASPTTPAPTSFADRLQALITAYSGEQVVLDDTDTPQHLAYLWILSDTTSSDGFSDDEILERYALATLFHSTDGGRWTTIVDYLLPSHHCDWSGVVCTNTEGLTITALAMANENLVGSLPKEIGLLTTLEELYLSGNFFTGTTIPTEIGYLTNLQVLQLIGPSSLPDLYELTLSSPTSESTSNVPPGNRRLEDILSPNVGLSGPLPTEFGALLNLVTLHLYGNSLSGTIPTEMGLLTSLQYLSMGNNLFSGSIPLQLGSNTALREFGVEQNSALVGTIPNIFCSSLSMIETLASDCLPGTDSDARSKVVCKCCNICCNADGCADVDVTGAPSSTPSTSFPSASPSSMPSVRPTISTPQPTEVPSVLPSSSPTMSPSAFPTTPRPTRVDTPSPTTSFPSSSPSTSVPSAAPTPDLTPFPSAKPSNIPTFAPTLACAIDTSSCGGRNACPTAGDLCVEANSCSARVSCNGASGDIGQGSCRERSSCENVQVTSVGDNSCNGNTACSGFQGISIGNGSCNCDNCCDCWQNNNRNELPDVIGNNACNVRGECCSTPSPTISPTRRPTPNPTPTPTKAPVPRTPRPTVFEEEPTVSTCTNLISA